MDEDRLQGIPGAPPLDSDPSRRRTVALPAARPGTEPGTRRGSLPVTGEVRPNPPWGDPAGAPSRLGCLSCH